MRLAVPARRRIEDHPEQAGLGLGLARRLAGAWWPREPGPRSAVPSKARRGRRAAAGRAAAAGEKPNDTGRPRS